MLFFVFTRSWSPLSHHTCPSGASDRMVARLRLLSLSVCLSEWLFQHNKRGEELLQNLKTFPLFSLLFHPQQNKRYRPLETETEVIARTWGRGENYTAPQDRRSSQEVYSTVTKVINKNLEGGLLKLALFCSVDRAAPTSSCIQLLPAHSAQLASHWPPVYIVPRAHWLLAGFRLTCFRFSGKRLSLHTHILFTAVLVSTRKPVLYLLPSFPSSVFSLCLAFPYLVCVAAWEPGCGQTRRTYTFNCSSDAQHQQIYRVLLRIYNIENSTFLTRYSVNYFSFFVGTWWNSWCGRQADRGDNEGSTRESPARIRRGERKRLCGREMESPFNFAIRFICSITSPTAIAKRNTLLIESTSMSTLVN